MKIDQRTKNWKNWRGTGNVFSDEMMMIIISSMLMMLMLMMLMLMVVVTVTVMVVVVMMRPTAVFVVSFSSKTVSRKQKHKGNLEAWQPWHLNMCESI